MRGGLQAPCGGRGLGQERTPVADRQGVLAVLYLVFTEGHLPGGGGDGIRDDLCAEAIRLARVLRALMPDEPEVAGLLALMLLTDARRAARLDAGGALVTLDAQDRTAWDREKIAEGHAISDDPIVRLYAA